MSVPKANLLKLKAESHDDLEILSACLQDACFPASAMHYDSTTKVFTILANRFMWEHEPHAHQGEEVYKRVHSGIYFSHVQGVKHKNVEQANTTEFLNLLAIHAKKDGQIHLVFSDQREICLHIDKITCHVKDLHEPWHTTQKPTH